MNMQFTTSAPFTRFTSGQSRSVSRHYLLPLGLSLLLTLSMSPVAFSQDKSPVKRWEKAPTRKTRTPYNRQRSAPGQVVKNVESVQENAVVETFRNSVEIKKSGENWSRAERNSTLKRSDVVKTGSRSMARLKLADGSKVLLLQNSQAEIDNLSTVEKTIKLLRGRVRAVVKRLKTIRSFKIETPVGVASVRGTEFEVEFNEGDNEMLVEVLKGSVAVARLGDLADEVILKPGQSLRFGAQGDLGDPIRTGQVPINRRLVQQEVRMSQVKDRMIQMAAIESRNADYQVGRSMIDVKGRRLRTESYIMRPQADQFKLVVLNKRSTRFDYFTYLGTFNQSLPEDLSLALGQLGGKLGAAAPDYYLTDYESVMSNTIDNITDIGSGGHLVKIEFDGTNYILTDANDPSNTRTIAAATLQVDGTYKIYNPIKDKFSLVTAANLADATKFSVLDSGVRRNLTTGDTYWKGRFNTNTFSINGTVKAAFTPTVSNVNTLAIDLDATFSNAPLTAVSEFPSGSGKVHNKLSLYYSDGSKLVYDNYIINDQGEIADTSEFSGVSSSAEYQNILEQKFYETHVTADEMNGRSIELVVPAEIGTISNLIQ